MGNLYQALVNMSNSLPRTDPLVLYVVLLGTAVLLAAVSGLLFFATGVFSLKTRSRQIIEYLSGVPAVESQDDERELTKKMFGESCPKYLREAWLIFADLKRGYPSAIVSEEDVFEKQKRFSDYPLYIFGALAFFITAAITVFLAGAYDASTLLLSVLLAVLLAVVLEAALFIVYRSLLKKTLKYFRALQDELDAKVLIQNISEYAADTEGLSEIADELEKMAARIDKIRIPDNYEDIVDNLKRREDPRIITEEELITALTESDDMFAAEVVVEESEDEETEDEQSEDLNIVGETQTGIDETEQEKTETPQAESGTQAEEEKTQIPQARSGAQIKEVQSETPQEQNGKQTEIPQAQSGAQAEETDKIIKDINRDFEELIMTGEEEKVESREDEE